MKTGLTLWQKVFIVVVCFAIAVIGFMVKLPPGFRHMDKELHAVFYFLAAALLNVLFAGTRLVRHVLVFSVLYLFGMVIEFAQDYSNRFFRTPIHGRYDPEDLQWNLKGLIAFSILWLLYTIVIVAYKGTMAKDKGYDSNPL